MSKLPLTTDWDTRALVRQFDRRRRNWNARPQPRWMKSVRVGDVLERKGTLRVVRAITFYACGALWGVHFTIKHCSWTHACDTVVDASRLQSEGWRPTGHRTRLTGRLDRRIQREILEDYGPHRKGRKRLLDCCDVKGVA